MFRSRRNTLVKRLWKSRPTRNETQRPSENASPEAEEDSQIKSVTQAMLKRLKEKHLEVLIQSVESKGGETTDCVLLPKGDVRLGRRTLPPHILCCQIWRWPDLEGDHVLKRLPCCQSSDDPTSICCNPYHWSRLAQTVSPSFPLPCNKAFTERVLQSQEGAVDGAISTETGGTPTAFRISCTDGSGPTHRKFWCNLAYWEHRERVGRLFTVFDSSVSVFQDLPHGDGMCLRVLQPETDCDSVKRTRDKIGFGLVLSQEGNGVWMYNRSLFPIFVNSPTLDIPNCRTTTVKKVLPGYSIKMFDYEVSVVLSQFRDPQLLDGPYDPNSIRISFAKGWGPSYHRPFVTSCPCWIEVLLRINR